MAGLESSSSSPVDMERPNFGFTIPLWGLVGDFTSSGTLTISNCVSADSMESSISSGGEV